MPRETMVAGIEAGGTKFRVVAARSPDEVAMEATIPTTTPAETIDQVLAHFDGAGVPVVAAGIATFGPVDLDPSSPTFGSIGGTPKPGWSGTDLLGPVETALGVPVAIDTDVGGAALAEWRWGAGRGADTVLYLTVGTGIGGGLVVGGRVHHGLGHPEMGHVPVVRVPGDDFPGACPFHGPCLEGMACGPAVADRWGAPAEALADRDEVWELEAAYLAQALRTFMYVAAPERIVLGGGVMQAPDLLDRVRAGLQTELAGYVAKGFPIDRLVVPAALGQDSGLFGAVALAQSVVAA